VSEGTWRGLPVFVSGGGANEERLATGIADHDYVEELVSPARPTNLRGAENADYRRLIVAYGLAFPKPIWPEGVSPSEIPPLQKPRRRHVPSSEELGYDEK
jgi:hypothetical protein